MKVYTIFFLFETMFFYNLNTSSFLDFLLGCFDRYVTTINDTNHLTQFFDTKTLHYQFSFGTKNKLIKIHNLIIKNWKRIIQYNKVKIIKFLISIPPLFLDFEREKVLSLMLLKEAKKMQSCSFWTWPWIGLDGTGRSLLLLQRISDCYQ